MMDVVSQGSSNDKCSNHDSDSDSDSTFIPASEGELDAEGLAETISSAPQMFGRTILDDFPTSKREPSKTVECYDGLKCTRSNHVLGKGSFGQVFLGMLQGGKMCAMKYLPIDYNAETEISQENFKTLGSEVALMAKSALNENVVQYYGFAISGYYSMKIISTAFSSECEDQLDQPTIICSKPWFFRDHFVIVMECVNCGSLQSIMNNFWGGFLGLPTLKKYFSDILGGLAFLHDQNIVHNDIKPLNVLVTVLGKCKLTDFGASNVISRLVKGDVLGTAWYDHTQGF
eukprot:gene16198-4923_t